MGLAVRELTNADVDAIVAYWCDSPAEDLLAMGADPAKVPARQDLRNFLRSQVAAPYVDKASLALIWTIDGQPFGHCNVNKIVFGQEAFMHLHLWKPESRHRGCGSRLVELSLPVFFDRLNLQVIYSDPYALNPAPNKTLAKVGFRFVKEHICVPGSLNFEQRVNRWEFRESWLHEPSPPAL